MHPSGALILSETTSGRVFYAQPTVVVSQLGQGNWRFS